MKRELREKVYAKYGGRCGYCGHEIEYSRMHIDHIHPRDRAHLMLAKYPEWNVNCLENLMPACQRCNLWKSTFSVEVFRRELQSQLERLRERSSNYRIALAYGLIVEREPIVRFYFEQADADRQ